MAPTLLEFNSFSCCICMSGKYKSDSQESSHMFKNIVWETTLHLESWLWHFWQLPQDDGTCSTGPPAERGFTCSSHCDWRGLMCFHSQESCLYTAWSSLDSVSLVEPALFSEGISEVFKRYRKGQQWSRKEPQPLSCKKGFKYWGLIRSYKLWLLTQLSPSY